MLAVYRPRASKSGVGRMAASCSSTSPTIVHTHAGPKRQANKAALVPAYTAAINASRSKHTGSEQHSDHFWQSLRAWKAALSWSLVPIYSAHFDPFAAS